ncbi:hypothetical protein LCGC14_0944770 [marine sediment metagenome]|uniref:Uncharacterized protein n=1 Tax=marine sediment metagenome TaxID=412755 RepID=A0A0F9P550_9ZZZZ
MAQSAKRKGKRQMKLKWYQYVLGLFQSIALVYKCGGFEKAGIYLEKEHDRLMKELATARIAGVRLQNINKLLKALNETVKAGVDFGQWEIKLMKLEGVELQVCLEAFMSELLDAIMARAKEEN